MWNSRKERPRLLSSVRVIVKNLREKKAEGRERSRVTSASVDDVVILVVAKERTKVASLPLRR
jgi:hypothetical protein